MRVLSTWHGPVEEIRNCVRKLRQYALACVRGTGHLKLYVLVECVLWIFASKSVLVYVKIRFHDCAALMIKDHPHHGHPSIAHQSPVSTDQQLMYSKNHIIRTCLMYHAACKVEFEPFKRSYSQLTFFNFKKKRNLLSSSGFR